MSLKFATDEDDGGTDDYYNGVMGISMIVVMKTSTDDDNGYVWDLG